jgi:hypothetical protein
MQFCVASTVATLVAEAGGLPTKSSARALLVLGGDTVLGERCLRASTLKEKRYDQGKR